jgi:hypothetical protein
MQAFFGPAHEQSDYFLFAGHSSRIAGSATLRGNSENGIGRGQRKDRILCSFEITNAIGYKPVWG